MPQHLKLGLGQNLKKHNGCMLCQLISAFCNFDQNNLVLFSKLVDRQGGLSLNTELVNIAAALDLILQ